MLYVQVPMYVSLDYKEEFVGADLVEGLGTIYVYL